MKNKRVLQAMAIGLSAVIATSGPISVLAEEVPGDDSAIENDENDEKDVDAAEETATVDEAKELAEKASKEIIDEDEVSTEEESSEVKVSDNLVRVADEVFVDGVRPDADLVVGEGTTEAGDAEAEDTKKDIQSAVDQVEGTVNELIPETPAEGTDDAAIKNAADKIVEIDDETLKTDIEEANDDVDAAADELDTAKSKDEEVSTEISNASTAAGTAGTVAAQVASDMETAADNADKAIEQINNATSESEAASALTSLSGIISDAETTYSTASDEYAKAKSAYDAAVKKAEEAETAYQTALTNAEGDADAAKAELDSALENVKALKTAADTAYQHVKDAEGIIELKDLLLSEQTQKDFKNSTYASLDKVFYKVISDYYVKYVLAADKELVGEVTTEKFQKFSFDYELNYVKVTYSYVGEDGETHTETKYVNYKIASQKDENGNTTYGFNIFEKVAKPFTVQEAEDEKYVIEKDGKDKIELSVEEFEAALEDGTIINIGTAEEPVYAYIYEEGDTTTEVTEGTVNGTPVTGEAVVNGNTTTVVTTTTNVTTSIDEDSEEVSYAYDDNGNLIKTVTGDVTTVTVVNTLTETTTVDTSSEGGSGNGTAASHDAAVSAAQTALGALTDGTTTSGNTTTATAYTDKDYSVTDSYTYTATATYIPTFTDTINVDENEWAWSASGAVDDVYEDKLDEYDDWKSYYVVSTSGKENLTAEKNMNPWGNYDRYGVHGTISVTYAAVSRGNADTAWYKDIWSTVLGWFGGNSDDKKKVEAIVKAKVEAEGGIYVGMNVNDWILGNYSYYYVAAQTATGTATASDAATAKATAESNATAQVGQHLGDASVSSSVTSETHTYSYTYTKTETVTTVAQTTGSSTSTSTAEGAVISTTAYDAANAEHEDAKELITETRYYNDNYYSKTGVTNTVTELNDGIALQDAADQARLNYKKISDEALIAQGRVETAIATVNELKAKIEALKNSERTTASELAALAAQLTIAEANYEAAKETLKEVEEKLDEAKDAYDIVVAELKDKESENTDNPSNDDVVDDDEEDNKDVEDDDDDGKKEDNKKEDNKKDNEKKPSGDSTNGGSNNGTYVVDDTVSADDTQGNVITLGSRTTRATGTTNNDADGDGSENGKQTESTNEGSNESSTVEDSKKAEKSTTVDGEMVPLAAMPQEEEAVHYSWWWLLILAILGALGFETYRIQKSKKAEATDTDSKKL